MSVYTRYFKVTQGPLIDAVVDANSVNGLAHKKYMEILGEIGASQRYYTRGGRMCGIVFKTTPDKKIFKETNHGWWPKKNCKAGKELCAKIQAVKTADVRDALRAVGLIGGCPVIFREGKAYYCTLVVIQETPPVAYVSVPWWDVDPEKMEQYKSSNADGKWFDANYDFVTWEPSPEMIEVKKWEVERHVYEWNSKQRAVDA